MNFAVKHDKMHGMKSPRSNQTCVCCTSCPAKREPSVPSVKKLGTNSIPCVHSRGDGHHKSNCSSLLHIIKM